MTEEQVFEEICIWKKSLMYDKVPDVVVCEIILREGDVGGHHHAHPAGHQPVLVEDDAGGHHETRVREEPSVVNIEKFP